jgi:hypothetical protein
VESQVVEQEPEPGHNEEAANQKVEPGRDAETVEQELSEADATEPEISGMEQPEPEAVSEPAPQADDTEELAVLDAAHESEYERIRNQYQTSVFQYAFDCPTETRCNLDRLLRNLAEEI